MAKLPTYQEITQAALASGDSIIINDLSGPNTVKRLTITEANKQWAALGSSSNPTFGDVVVTSITGDGSGLTGIGSGTGGVINTGSTTIGADSDADGVGVIALQTRGVTRATIANLGGMIIGSGISVPDGSGLHIHIGTAGSVTADTAADDLVIESSVDAGISILNPNTASSRIIFGSPADNKGAEIFYRQNIAKMSIGTNLAGGILAFNTADGVEAGRFDAVKNFGVGNTTPGTTQESSAIAGTSAHVLSTSAQAHLVAEGLAASLILIDSNSAADDKVFQFLNTNGLASFSTSTDADPDSGTGLANILTMDMGTGAVGIKKVAANGVLDINLATEDFSIGDAGSTGATEQDWVEVTVGGITGYIHIFAAK
jgi:hypothetical protein